MKTLQTAPGIGKRKLLAKINILISKLKKKLIKILVLILKKLKPNQVQGSLAQA